MSFALDLAAFAEKTAKKSNAIVRKIVLDVGTSLVMKSPVGDADYWIMKPPPGYVGGRFRGNWQYQLGSPDISTTEATDKTGAKTLGDIRAKLGKDAAGGIHYLTNSLPYSLRLEEGWSKRQAPNGMVAITILEFKPIVEAAAKALR